MRIKLGLAILALALAGVLAALLVTKHADGQRIKADRDAILDFSNQLITARANLDELGQVNLRLTNDLAESRRDAVTFSNQLTDAAGDLAVTRNSLEGARSEITNLNQRLTGLAAQNQVLDQRAAALASAIDGLNAQIAETRERLADSETNNGFLERELQRQTAARAQLESKFNDLAAVRTQVKKLKQDQVIARRLEWMREGTEPTRQLKSAQQLALHSAPPPPPPPHYDLNVEVGADGAIRVLSALSNAPAPAP